MMEGLSLLESDILNKLGVAHGFTNRLGGVSSAPFGSLNLGSHVGDAAQDVTENRRRVNAALGASADGLACVSQVHRIARHRVEGGGEQRAEADILFCERPGIAIAVMVADCTPILITSPDGRAVCAIHAGWRGTVANIVAVAVRAFETAGYKANVLAAAIGPCIERAQFEVGPEVIEAIKTQSFGSQGCYERSPGKAKKYLVDLKRLNYSALVKAGLVKKNIDVLSGCTFLDPNFFSYRRDGARSGRQGGIIVAR